MGKIITLLSDFGLEDGYVACMKGVMLNIHPSARLVDISHQVPPQDIQAGAFILGTTCRYFPAGTIHLAVVDPGVGTTRRPLMIEAGGQFFVGPDNGLFSWVLESMPSFRALELDCPQYWLPSPSRTFHGRDIFAPVAAHLAAGIPPRVLGTPCEPVMTDWFRVQRGRDGLIVGQIVHMDHFGNAVTNIREEDVKPHGPPEDLEVELPSPPLLPVAGTYGDVAAGEGLALFGSHGFLEIAVNGGSAARELKLHRGALVRVRPGVDPPKAQS